MVIGILSWDPFLLCQKKLFFMILYVSLFAFTYTLCSHMNWEKHLANFWEIYSEWYIQCEIWSRGLIMMIWFVSKLKQNCIDYGCAFVNVCGLGLAFGKHLELLLILPLALWNCDMGWLYSSFAIQFWNGLESLQLLGTSNKLVGGCDECSIVMN